MSRIHIISFTLFIVIVEQTVIASPPFLFNLNLIESGSRIYFPLDVSNYIPGKTVINFLVKTEGKIDVKKKKAV